jgi:hypothetical protein
VHAQGTCPRPLVLAVASSEEAGAEQSRPPCCEEFPPEWDAPRHRFN